MADLSVTATSVDWTSGVAPQIVRFGSTVTRGKTVYLDTADNEWKLADANVDMTAIPKGRIGIALTDGSDAKPGLVALDGATINIGATTTAGLGYAITSADIGTAGGIVLESALGTADTPVRLFYGTGSGAVTLAIVVCSVQKA